MSKTSTVIVSGRTFTISNLGPLTTAFVPPRECFASWYETGMLLKLGVPDQTNCLPPGFSNNSPKAGYYSPGLCPASYTQAKPLSSWWLTPGETGVHCCPTGFSIATAIDGDLVSSCTEVASNTVTFSDGTWGFTATMAVIWAPAIPVIWKSAAEFPPNSTPTTEGSSAPETLTTSTSAEDPNVSPWGSRLSPGITISIAVPVALIALFTLAFIIYRRRRRQNPVTTTNGDTALPELDAKSYDHDLPTTEPHFRRSPVELSTQQAQSVVELPSLSTPRMTVATFPTAHPPVSRTPIPATWSPPRSVVDGELQQLHRERVRIHERRERLLQLEALDAEDSQLRRRIDERMSRM